LTKIRGKDEPGFDKPGFRLSRHGQLNAVADVISRCYEPLRSERIPSAKNPAQDFRYD